MRLVNFKGGWMDISACENMGILELVPGRLHALRENKSGLWAMDLDHLLRLILEPAGDHLPVSKEGWLDLEKVTAIKIIKTEDCHGK